MRSQIYMDPTILITQWLPVLNTCEMFLNKAIGKMWLSDLLHIAVHMWAFTLPLLWVSVLYKHENIPTACQEDNEKYELIDFWLSEWWKGGKSVCVHRFSDACERNPSTAWDQKEWEKKQERWKSIGWIYLFSTQRRWNNRSFALEQSLLMMMNLCRTFLLATALRPCSSQSPNPADCNPSFSDSLPLTLLTAHSHLRYTRLERSYRRCSRSVLF